MFSTEEYKASLRRFYFALAVVLVVLAIGIVVIRLLSPETPFIKALYFAVITITTIGYEEVIDVQNIPWGMTFVTVYALFGMGAMLWFVTVLNAFIFEGHLFALNKRGKLMKAIDKLRDHAIICGAGKTGMNVVAEFERVKRSYVVIDNNPEAIERIITSFPDALALQGDATDEHVLELAGIHKAQGLISCLRDDKDNTFVVLTARTIQPNIHIISRANQDVQDKVKKAGADIVVSPNYIGGLRMASTFLRPTAVGFMDVLMRDPKFTWRIEDLAICGGSQLIGKTLAQADINKHFKVLVLAIKRNNDADFVVKPGAEEVISEGDRLVVMAELESIFELRKMCGF